PQEILESLKGTTMKVRYDPSVDMLYIDLNDAEIVNSDEIQEGIVADYDKDGNIIGIEIFDASERVSHPERVEYRVLEEQAIPAGGAGASLEPPSHHHRPARIHHQCAAQGVHPHYAGSADPDALLRRPQRAGDHRRRRA